MSAYVIRLFAGLPTADGQRWNTTAFTDLLRSNAVVFEYGGSLLANAFNQCWVAALNFQPRPTHFLLLHADVIPQQLKTMRPWPLVLLDEMHVHQAGVLSVAMPIKSDLGLTSTALETDDRWRPRRLSTAEMAARPETWTSPDLLVNTGLLLVDFRQPWVERVCFTINDSIRHINGQFVAETEPEDWHFSRQCRALGVPVYVTRVIPALHVGRKWFSNTEVWGQPTDPQYAIQEQ